CADVLVAGERGGKLASMVFAGVGIGGLWKALSWVFNLFLKELDYSTPRSSQFPNATLNVDISPEYMGVGYVIGPRIAGTMFAGGVLSWLVLLPLPTIIASAREGLKGFGAGAGTGTVVRTERDLPTAFVLGGSLLLAIFLAVAPKMPTQGNFLAAILVIIFGFLFVTVSSRITGLI